MIKHDECNDNQNDKKMKHILTWPSLWLQVFHKGKRTNSVRFTHKKPGLDHSSEFVVPDPGEEPSRLCAVAFRFQCVDKAAICQPITWAAQTLAQSPWSVSQQRGYLMKIWVFWVITNRQRRPSRLRINCISTAANPHEETAPCRWAPYIDSPFGLLCLLLVDILQLAEDVVERDTQLQRSRLHLSLAKRKQLAGPTLPKAIFQWSGLCGMQILPIPCGNKFLESPFETFNAQPSDDRQDKDCQEDRCKQKEHRIDWGTQILIARQDQSWKETPPARLISFKCVGWTRALVATIFLSVWDSTKRAHFALLGAGRLSAHAKHCKTIKMYKSARRVLFQAETESCVS